MQAITASPSAFLAYLQVLTALAAGDKGARSMYLQASPFFDRYWLLGRNCLSRWLRATRALAPYTCRQVRSLIAIGCLVGTFYRAGCGRQGRSLHVPAGKPQVWHSICALPEAFTLDYIHRRALTDSHCPTLKPACLVSPPQLCGDDHFAMVCWAGSVAG